ncbi:TetR/AcrR family transcriptional regulator [Sphingobium sp. DC-2]|uniref:TetR/AcrR family transcriptional regulator n=1 Tax=Sphingobium sp. DC-2 TaxID=1303256 RepID=UPI0004C3E92E|nr:TetR/AcrR family transcriptional regulator [Sphingobium sp. DC-2]
MTVAGKSLSRRERNKQEKLERIIAASRKLFHSHGFEETTTAQIAREAGVAEGTLFLYAAKKEDLLILAFVEEMKEVVMAAFETIDQSAPLIEQFLSFFQKIFAYHHADRKLAKAVLREVGFYREPGLGAQVENIPIAYCLTLIVERAKKQGLIDPGLPTMNAAMMAFSAYWYYLRDWVNERISAQDFASGLRDGLNILHTGLQPAAARQDGRDGL